MKKWLPSGKKILYLHPLLFAVMPVLTLYSTNLSQAHLRQIFRSMLVCSAGTAALLLILWLTLKNLERAALTASLIVILFFTYGHVYRSVFLLIAKTLVAREILLDSDQLTLASHTVMLALWTLVILFGLVLIKRTEVWRPQITNYFAILGIVAVLFPTVNIFKYHRAISALSDLQVLTSANDIEVQRDTSLPDIYYIILDGYGRQDVLQDVYQYDNSPFLNHLQELGFHVAKESRSNYQRTHLSLTSSLNMDYMEQFMEFPSTDPLCLSLVTQHLASAEVLQYLRRHGYQVYALATNFELTEMRTADHHILSGWSGLNGFEALMIRNSFPALLYDLSSLLNNTLEYPGHQAHRNHIDFTLETLEEMPGEPGPKFVFAHILSPHPPFVFGPEGEHVKQQLPFSLSDGDEYPGTEEEYILGYKSQATYINSRIEELVQRLIENSDVAPIIILQGDHGPKSSMEGGQISYEIFKETVAILNAYYFPDAAYDDLYPSISPVNTFRIVLNHFFNEDYALIPDLTYFITGYCGDTVELIPEENELEVYFENRGN